MEKPPTFNLFISYVRQDRELTVRLANDLIDNGINVLYDENLLETGIDWQMQLTDALNKADGVLVLITPNMTISSYVNRELEAARSYYDRKEKLLLPVVYDNARIPSFIKDIQAIY